jgi:hypothetical protein
VLIWVFIKRNNLVVDTQLEKYILRKQRHSAEEKKAG